MTAGWYTVVVLLVALERLAELVVARRHLTWALARGGVESGQRHYPAMVVLHTGLLVGCLVEAWWRRPDGHPLFAVVGLVVVVAAQALRWWCIRTLGPQWNTKIVVVPGLGAVRTGPYAVLPHPNYVAVALEGLALPLLGSAVLTAVAFTLLNAALMAVRIPAEEAALRAAVPVPGRAG
ncbi:isoprenylcysteine carboxylmethyltransferase family protein [Dermatophilaceae bacterium Soc4.6]